MIQSLHSDIIRLVIDEFKGCKSSLKRFSLVNRSEWLSHSRNLLFGSITLLDYRIDSFLSLCISPCSTLRWSIRDIRLLQCRISSTDGREMCSSPVDSSINKLLAWKTTSSVEYPHLSTAEFLCNLQHLVIGGVQWWDLTETAKCAIPSFVRVTTLELHHVDFRTGDEFSRLLCSLPALECLVLDRVIQRTASVVLELEPISDTIVNITLPPIHTIRCRNILQGSGSIIEALLPFCSTMRLLDFHFLGYPLASIDSCLAVAHLITAAGSSLRGLLVKLPANLEKDLASSFLDEWDVAKNTNLKELLLDINMNLQPFLQKMTSPTSCGYNIGPSDLEVLHAPWLVMHSQNLPSLDTLLQHPCFTSLVSLRSLVRVRPPSDQQWFAPSMGLNATQEKLTEAIKHCQAQLSGCHKRGILELYA